MNNIDMSFVRLLYFLKPNQIPSAQGKDLSLYIFYFALTTLPLSLAESKRKQEKIQEKILNASAVDVQEINPSVIIWSLVSFACVLLSDTDRIICVTHYFLFFCSIRFILYVYSVPHLRSKTKIFGRFPRFLFIYTFRDDNITWLKKVPNVFVVSLQDFQSDHRMFDQLNQVHGSMCHKTKNKRMSRKKNHRVKTG